MGRFKIERNTNKEQKQLLQAKLEASLVEEVNMLCQWSGNEKNFVIAQLLRYALSQESDFQQYKHGLAPRIHAQHVESKLKSSVREQQTA